MNVPANSSSPGAIPLTEPFSSTVIVFSAAILFSVGLPDRVATPDWLATTDLISNILSELPLAIS